MKKLQAGHLPEVPPAIVQPTIPAAPLIPRIGTTGMTYAAVGMGGRPHVRGGQTTGGLPWPRLLEYLRGPTGRRSNRLLDLIRATGSPGAPPAPPAPAPAPAPKPKPKPKPKPRAPTFERELATAGEAIMKAPRPARAETFEAIAALIEKHAVAGPTGVAKHGMRTQEDFRTIKLLGINWHFSGTAAAGSGITKQMAVWVFRGGPATIRRKIPRRLARSTKDVFMTAQVNRDDDYWRSRYKDFDKSLATGGDEEIVVYGDDTITLGSLAHEMGHNLAEVIYGSTTPIRDYALAIGTTEPPVSEYAKNSDSEDFAESLKSYVTERAKMKADFPVRYRIIHKIMTDLSYGG
jgi:hypothetical protein